MTMIIEDNGTFRRLEDIELAEKIVELRNNKSPWAVIDELVKAWVKKAPDEVKAVRIDVDNQRELLTDRKFGQTAKGGQFERRFTLLFPNQLQMLIRTQYKSQELPFDSKFFREFAKRYPSFKVAQEV